MFGPVGKVDDEILETEIMVNRQHEVMHVDGGVHDLIFGTENVCIVLCEGAHAHQTVKRTRRLVVVHRAEFRDLLRQIPVGFQTILEYLDVARTIHRLQREDTFILGLGDEHVFMVLFPVAGGFPKRAVEQLRRVHLDISGVFLASAHVGYQFLVQRPAFRVPEHHARAFLLEVEQVHFAPEPPMVPFLGLLQHEQVGLQVLCRSTRPLRRSGSAWRLSESPRQ